MDYYDKVLEHYPSEKIMNRSLRMFMPYLAGHSILDWSGPAVSCCDGLRALTAWAEKGIAPDALPTVRYDFEDDCPREEGSVEVYSRWRNRSEIQKKLSLPQ